MKAAQIVDLLQFKGKLSKRLTKANLLFMFVFLNIWDFAINRIFFNGMVLSVVMFGPIVFLWYLGKFRAVVLLTLLSIFEFVVMLIFVLQGFELGGLAITLKSVFWIPYLLMAGVNMVFGLKIYAEAKEKQSRV